MSVCPSCGHENRDGARFCDACGSALAVEESAGSRRTVTVLFTDIVGSTELGERLDPERLQALLTRYFDAARTVIERHGGTVEKYIGDAVVAVFGVPRLREDDALRAVRAAAEIREALDALNHEIEGPHAVRLSARTGLHTGEVIVGDAARGGKLATGDAMNVAARLEQGAGADVTLISATTHRLVQDAVEVEEVEPLELKGKSEPVRAYRLVKVDPSALGFARRLTAPMVGRDRELSLLRAAFDRAVSDGACQLFTVLGVGGVGKSRLLGAFVDQLGDRATVLRGRCLPYGDGITFWPIIEALRPAAGISGSEDATSALAKIAALVPDDDQADRIARQVAQVMGLQGGEAIREETFWAIRRLLEGMARTRPVALVIDDLQWAEPTMLELVEHIAEWAIDAPVLVACMARPELLETSPGWGGGKLNATSISLEPLSPTDLGSLVTNLLAADRLDATVRDRIVDAAEGHPLFAEETLAMLVEQGRIVLEGETWVAAGDLAELAVPPTTSALIVARIDQLDAKERAALQRAAVMGQVFYRDAVAELGDADPTRELSALTRKQFIHPDRSDLPGTDALAFRHLMIRDAAYEGIPKADRADLHERFADWLELAVADRRQEYDEILGFHLERACGYRADVGEAGAHERAIARRAADRFASAARRATARVDLPAAASLLGRAVAVLDPEDPMYPELLWETGVALNRQGDDEGAARVLAEAVTLASAAGDPRLERLARLDLAWAYTIGARRMEPGDLLDLATSLIPELERSGDDLGLTKAWQLIAEHHWGSGHIEAMREPLARALLHARQAGDRLEENEVLVSTLYADRLGPATPTEMLARFAAVAREGGWRDRRSEGEVLGCEAVARAMLGEFGPARTLLDRYAEIIRDLGIIYVEWWLAETTWTVEMLAGDAVAAEAGIRIAEGGSKPWNEPVEGAYGSRLAHALCRQGRYEDAAEVLQAVDEDLTHQQVGTRVLWLSAAGKVDARRSDPAEGLSEAHEAAELAATTDLLNLHGDTLMDLADVLSVVGRDAEAAPVVQEALALYERKGNVVSAARAAEALARLSGA